MGSGLAASLRPGMTFIWADAHSSSAGYRSRQSGFCSSISRIFQSLRHFLSAFSRAIASLGSSWVSNQTRRSTPYRALKPRTSCDLCSCTRRTRSPVTPRYSVPCLRLARRYTQNGNYPLRSHSGTALWAGPGTYEHGSRTRKHEKLQNCLKPVCMGSGLAALLRPGMTLIVISVYRRSYSSNTGYRSRQSGFCSSMRRIFQSRRHFLSAFSRAIASLGSS